MGLPQMVTRHLWHHLKCGLRDIFPDPLLRKNKVFMDRHAGQRGFILGSGHSILEQDLTRLNGEVVMTQNQFIAHKDISAINPMYHVIVPKYHPREYDADWITWLKQVEERLPGHTALFFDKNTKYLIDQSSLFQGRAYYIRQGYHCALVKRARTDITRALMAVPTMLPECLAIAIYMGFKEIFLLGFDMDQVSRIAGGKVVSFYGSSPMTANRAEQELNQRVRASGLHFINMWVIWRQCILLRTEAERKGIRIINATRGGLLDVFERANYEDLVK